MNIGTRYSKLKILNELSHIIHMGTYKESHPKHLYEWKR